MEYNCAERHQLIERLLTIRQFCIDKVLSEKITSDTAVTNT